VVTKTGKNTPRNYSGGERAAMSAWSNCEKLVRFE